MESIAGRAEDLAEFTPEGVGRKVLFRTDRLAVVLAAFEPGQEIPLHSPNLDLVLTVLDGTGEVMIGDRIRHVRAGDVCILPAGIRRGIRAREGRLVVLHVVSPPPTAADHAGMEPWPAAAAETTDGPAALIKQEHAELLGHIEHLGVLAREVATLDERVLRDRLGAVLGFLRDGLLPHARAEEEILYPEVEKVLRAVGGATRTMEIDHRAIGQMIEDLARAAAAPLDEARRESQRVLVALQSLLGVHFVKEEEVYVPLLARLGREESEALRVALLATGHGPGHAH